MLSLLYLWPPRLCSRNCSNNRFQLSPIYSMNVYSSFVLSNCCLDCSLVTHSYEFNIFEKGTSRFYFNLYFSAAHFYPWIFKPNCLLKKIILLDNLKRSPWYRAAAEPLLFLLSFPLNIYQTKPWFFLFITIILILTNTIDFISLILKIV